MQRNFHFVIQDQEHPQYQDPAICSLTRELCELKDLQVDFLRLNDEVDNLQSKYALLLDQSQRTENHFKINANVNTQAIHDMRAQIQTLKMHIQKASMQIQDSTRQHMTLQRVCENKQADVQTISTKNRQLEKNTEQQEEENKALTMNLTQLKEQKAKHEAQCERLSELLDQNLSTIKQYERESKILQSKNIKLEHVYVKSEAEHHSLVGKLKVREQTAAEAGKKICLLEQQDAELKQKIAMIERQCEKTRAQYESFNQSFQASSNQKKDLNSRLKALQSSVRSTENEFQAEIMKRQNLKKNHFQYVDENKNLNTQIDKCLLVIMQYEKVNNDLQRQVQSYIQCDEQARKMLNRRQSMKHLLEKVNNKLRVTESAVAHLKC